jgi:hypothetical protein
MRNALVGGATGAGIGALSGGLSVRHIPEGMVESAFVAGRRIGQAEGAEPGAIVEALEGMAPDARRVVLKQFNKGWLTRMFGG